MKLFPAIDLYNQQCVRLQKGKFDTVTTYESDPINIAKKYEREGAKYLHVIDLNGAETGKRQNYQVIEEIIKQTNLNVQVGGGIRIEEDIDLLLELGVFRVILGSFALKELNNLDKLVKKYQDKIIVSVDSNNGFVTYNGWQNTSGYKTIDFCKKIEESGIKTIVYTDISKDGMMQGPNFEDYQMIQKNTKLDVIASGGVSSLKDVKQLNEMNLYGSIIGKALYIGEVTVKEMVSCLQEESYRV